VLADRAVDDPDVDVIALGASQLARAEDPAGLPLVGPLAFIALEMIEHPLIGHRSAYEGANALVELVIGARLRVLALVAALVLRQPVQVVARRGDVPVE
jgi:hypothetical protein